jgi:alkylhydroperoxidase family enzyme
LSTFPVSEVRDRISDAENGTLQWISSEPKIDQWQKSESSSLLWINGSPGQGKSVLCKHLLEKLEEKVEGKQKASSHKIIYFFCSGQLDPRFRNAETILRTLIVQLLSSPRMFTHLPMQYQKKAENFETAPLARLWAIFRDMISDEYHREICCLLDALDEFENGIIDLLERIRRLLSSSIPATKRPTIKFLITSRHEKDISHALANTEALSLQARREDVQRFIGAKLESLSSPFNRLKPMIKERLAAKAGSTFLWVSIVIRKIKRLELPNQNKVMREIEESPQELDELYQKLAEQLFKEEDTARLLTWVTYARKPLSLRELETALAVRPEENCCCIKDTEKYRTQLTESSVNESAGLLLEVIDGNAYLIHQSVKDFLLKADNPLAASDFLHKEKPDTFLARTCIRYLDFDDFESAPLFTDVSGRGYSERREIISQYPLLEYASRHWYSHVRGDDDAYLLSSAFNGILCHENIRTQLWFTIASGRRTECATRGSIAIELDIDWLARLILHEGRGGVEEHFPVDCLKTLAANGGQVLEALLDYGEPYPSSVTEEVVKVAARNINGERVMTLLLDRRGDDVRITEEVVKAAAMNSNEAIMTLLMDRLGDDVQITEEVVKAAAWNFNGEVMALLLDQRGDDVQITEEVVKAAAANWNGKKAMTVLLDRRGDDVRITQGVVEEAAMNYNGEVMAVLLGRRGNDIQLTEELTAWIATRFSVEVMALLLDRQGDNVQITEEVVKAAIMNRMGKEIVALLLDRRGDDIQITEGVVKAAASAYFTSRVMALLIDRRGDDIPITEELTALIAERSSVEAMALLLDRRSDDVQITEKVVKAAARNRKDEKVMALLLDQRGDDVQITEEVMKAAAGNPNEAIMALLLDRRRDDVQITEEVVKAAEGGWNDGKVKRLLLDRRGDDVQITEDVIKAAATASQKQVLV